MSTEKNWTFNWPWGVACGLIFGGGTYLIWHDKPFWALAMLAVGLGVGMVWPTAKPSAK